MPTAKRRNPYVGPYSFGEEDADYFFGRDREARHLTAITISEQVVLFCAQSGAGKTSLVNTKLIPSLREQGFHVFPPARVGGDLPSGVVPANVFAFNALQTLSSKRALAPGDTLDSFLLPSPDSQDGHRPRVLILDQFEEILTTYPEHREHREGFFLQLRQALQRDSKLSVVLVMREDHIVGLDRYATLLSGLRTRFRMERLRVEEAVAAIRKPAELAGRPFADQVAEALAMDLCQLHIADQEKTVPGEFVEPVHLQIVCRELWENLRDQPGNQITGDDLKKFGDIDQALELFYERAVKRAASVPGASLKKVRDFCGTTLITPTRIRNQVSRGSKETGGLPNKAVEVLVEAHLIRPEQVRGGTWYELAHDRLIEPILESNQTFFKPGKSQLSRDAQAWQHYDNDSSFLYRGSRLEKVLKDNPQETLGELEREFLRAAQEWENEQRRRNTWRMGFVITCLALLLLVAVFFALTSWRESRLSVSRELALAAVNRTRSDPQLSLLLALEALDRKPTLEAEAALHQALTASVITPVWFVPIPSDSAGLLALSTEAGRIALVDAKGIVIRTSGTGETVRRLGGLPSTVTSLALNRQGDRLAAGSKTGLISIWRLGSQAPRRTFQTGYEVNALAFSPNADLIAVAGNSSDASVWSTDSGIRVSSLTGGHESLIWDIAFSPDGRSVATAGDDGKVLVWDLRTGRIVQRLTPGSPVTGVAFGADDRLATASQDSLARIWNLKTSEALLLVGHRDRVWDVAFSNDGQYVATASADRTVKLWRSDLGQEIRTLDLEGGEARAVAFGGPGKLATTNLGFRRTHRGTATVWRLLLKDVPILSGHTNSIFDVTFSPDGQRLASSDSGGQVILWTREGERLATFPQLNAPIRKIAFDDSGDFLATACSDGSVRLSKVPSGEKVVDLPHSAALNAVAFAAGGERLAAAAMDGTVTIWDVARRRKIRVLKAHAGPVLDTAFSPDGRWLATAGTDSVVKLWDVQTGKALHTLDKHASIVYRLAFNARGDRLATASVDTTAKLWDPQTGTELLTLSGHGASRLTSVAFSPDGRRVATGSVDSTVKLWDAEDGRELFTLSGHTDSISGVSFSSDGKLLATASADRTIRLEPLAIEDLVHIARQRLSRGLTDRERQIYLHE